MKKKKLDLNVVNIKSFVTGSTPKTIKGGDTGGYQCTAVGCTLPDMCPYSQAINCETNTACCD